MLRDYKSSPPRVVIVENDPDFSEFLGESFADTGFVPQCFRTYQDALAYIVNRPVDLVTTHIQKEKPEGYHFIRHVRKCPKGDVAIMVITGSVDKNLVVKLAPLKVNKILVKPLDIVKALACAAELINFNTTLPDPSEKSDSQDTQNSKSFNGSGKDQKPPEDSEGFEVTDEAV